MGPRAPTGPTGSTLPPGTWPRCDRPPLTGNDGAVAKKTGTADRLEQYRSMRHFEKTAEPAGGDGAGEPGRHFVVQRHRARRLHYDLRLELDGVLVSWAVPKGPTLDPTDRRLAVHVEDHPIEYADFE